LPPTHEKKKNPRSLDIEKGVKLTLFLFRVKGERGRRTPAMKRPGEGSIHPLVAKEEEGSVPWTKKECSPVTWMGDEACRVENQAACASEKKKKRITPVRRPEEKKKSATAQKEKAEAWAMSNAQLEDNCFSP